jgi:hypothetical protein
LIKQISSTKTDRILANGSKIFGQQFNYYRQVFIETLAVTVNSLSRISAKALKMRYVIVGVASGPGFRYKYSLSLRAFTVILNA